MKKNTFINEKNIITASKYPHLKDCTEVCTNHDNFFSLKTIIDTNHHTYLHHHVFGEKCYVPATMFMELFAESALFFLCQLYKDETHIVVTGLENFHVFRALAIDPGDKIETWINLKEITGLHSKILTIEIASKRISENGKIIGVRVNATCNVIVSETYELTEKFNLPPPTLTHYCFPKKSFYKNYFPSLGDLFQTQSGNFKVSFDENTLWGNYNMENKERKFIKGQDSNFILSPLGLDSCLQITVFLSRLLALRGRLPVSCLKLKLFREHPLNGQCKVFVQCKHIDDSIMKACWWAFDSANQLIAYTEDTVVQYAPVNNTAEIYHNWNLFFSLLDKYMVAEESV